MKLSDNEIIEGLRSKDERIISLLYKDCFQMCKSIVCYKGGSVEDAEDIFQDALQSLFYKLSKQDIEIKVSFKSYLFGIFNNLWKLQLERKRRHSKFEKTHVVKQVVEQVIDEYDRQLCSSVLWNCYQELRENCRMILKLVWQGYPLKEIAEILSIKYGYLRRKKFDCHHSLSEIIKKSAQTSDLLKNDFPELFEVLK